jgi:phosphoglycolate phosphatase-like HAD superfamily hydrolase
MGTYLIDIDGTIADNKHREWVLKENRPRPNWDLFFNLAGQDKPFPHMVKLLHDLRSDGSVIIYVTGRPERLRVLTENWIEDHGFPLATRMFMRTDGDHRPDEIIKAEILDALLATGHKITMAFDDRNKVVAMWRARGIPCAQVAEGNF